MYFLCDAHVLSHHETYQQNGIPINPEIDSRSVGEGKSQIDPDGISAIQADSTAVNRVMT